MSFLALSRHVMCMLYTHVTNADLELFCINFLHILGRWLTFPVVKMMPHSGVD